MCLFSVEHITYDQSSWLWLVKRLSMILHTYLCWRESIEMVHTKCNPLLASEMFLLFASVSTNYSLVFHRWPYSTLHFPTVFWLPTQYALFDSIRPYSQDLKRMKTKTLRFLRWRTTTGNKEAQLLVSIPPPFSAIGQRHCFILNF